MIRERKKTIKMLYDLEYDNSGLNSGLIKWYNQLLDKVIDELDEIDISKMIRQDILKGVAIDRAIDIIRENPIAGEMYDGDIVNLLSSLVEKNQLSLTQLEEIKAIVKALKEQQLDFEWGENEDKEQFVKNLDIIISN